MSTGTKPPENNRGWISIRDPIHGYIVLPKEFTIIIDDIVFQRLRDVKQLGLTHYVFPGAVHNRFSHLLGTAYTAMRILDSLTINTEKYVLQYLNNNKKKKCIQGVLSELSKRENYYSIVLAALMHDIGHIAFSHLAEEAVPDLALLVEAGDINSSAGLFEVLGNRLVSDAKMHEDLTISIVEGYIKPITSTIDSLSQTVEIAASILKNSYNSKYYKECDDNVNRTCADEKCSTMCLKELVKCIGVNIINNPLDADRLDFLLRDSYYAGIMGPRPDIHRLLETFVIAPLPDSVAPFRGKPTLAIVDKGLDTVEHTLLSRVYLYKDVYLHTVSLAYEGIAKRLISLLLLLASSPAQPREKVIKCLKMIVAENPETGGEAYRECLLTLTDTGLTTLIRRLALDDSSEVYRLILDNENGPYTDTETAKKSCLTLALAARAIHGRRHWPFIPVEGPIAASLLNTTRYYPLNPRGLLPRPRAERTDYSVLDKLVRKTTPITIIETAIWATYDSSRHEQSKRIWIFSRKLRDSLLLSKHVREPEISTHKVVLDEIDGKSFTKLLILNPFLNPKIPLLPTECPDLTNLAKELISQSRMKQGKLKSDDYKYALRVCGLQWSEVPGLIRGDMRALSEIVRHILRYKG